MQRKQVLLLCRWLVVLVCLWSSKASLACTNFIVTPGASIDGSTLITYSADSHTLYGYLRQIPAGDHSPSAMVDVFDSGSGKFLGRIRQAAHTFSVVGLMNEHQVAIGETTFGGRPELQDPKGILDYEPLMVFALQRSKTAREAIQTMGALVAEYGYASTGESMSVSDPTEAWIFEIIGKGPGNKGAVWVGRRVPDGYVSGHANQARIRRFPLNDPANCLYAPDTISFARQQGFFNGKDEEFSFADAYAPLSFGGLRFCEARVWSMFRRMAPSLKLSSDWVKGIDTAEPLPLWIRPDRKLGVADLMQLMRDHFEDSEFDLSKGIGAGPYGLPYRWRPLTWKVDGVEYLNERSTATQQTAFSFVNQSRPGMPGPIGGISWFGVDDAGSTVYIPMYCGLQKAPPAFAEGAGTLHRFSWDSAFWVFTSVANFAYSRYNDIIQDIQKVQLGFESEFLARVKEIDAAALKLYQESPESARRFLTDYSTGQAERVMARWRLLLEELIVKYMDGNVKDEMGDVKHPGYPQDWYRALAKADDGRLRVLKLKNAAVTETPVKVNGYFHSREELGSLAGKVPADFPFASEKLVLMPGTCPATPNCCVTPQVETATGKLVLRLPESKPEECGTPGWLIRLPKNETRPLVLRAESH